MSGWPSKRLPGITFFSKLFLSDMDANNQNIYNLRYLKNKNEVNLADFVFFMDYINENECPVCCEEKNLIVPFKCHYFCKSCQNQMI